MIKAPAFINGTPLKVGSIRCKKFSTKPAYAAVPCKLALSCKRAKPQHADFYYALG